jgi:hypothetical protein
MEEVGKGSGGLAERGGRRAAATLGEVAGGESRARLR